MECSRFEDIESDGICDQKGLQDTNFIKAYDNTAKPPSDAAVRKAVEELGGVKAGSLYSGYAGTVAEKAIQLWSSNAIYKQLNNNLIADEEADTVAVVSRAMNYYLVYNRIPKPVLENAETLMAYRGSKLTKKQWCRLVDGEVYRPPFYMAVSPSPEQAEVFAVKYICVFEIPYGSYNACDISHLNVHEEKEILFPPYTPIKLRNKNFVLTIGDKTYPALKYEVLDGLVHEQAVEKPSATGYCGKKAKLLICLGK